LQIIQPFLQCSTQHKLIHYIEVAHNHSFAIEINLLAFIIYLQ
jgi:hypothetical protein